MENVLAILLAGGTGERMFPLTRNTAKPAVPFGGIYRIIDFTLSNCVNSGLRRIFCFTQYKSLELTRHLREGWNLFAGEMGEFIEVIPPMQRVHTGWYLGTADSVYQNLESIERERPADVLILAGDQIYKMDYQEMLGWHRAHQADVTIATLQIPPDECGRFGIAEIHPQSHRILGFEEKPAHDHAARSPFDPSMVSASMGIYMFRTEVLRDALREDAASAESAHDFGHNVIPALLKRHNVVAYDFHDLNNKRVRYWRDVGTIDAYYEANMDLVSVTPEFNLYDNAWPLRTRNAAGAAGQVRLRPGEPAHGRGDGLDRVAGGDYQRGAAAPLDCQPGGAREQLLRHRIFDPVARGHDRPLLPHPPCDHRQRRAPGGGHRDRRGCRARPRRGPPCHRRRRDGGRRALASPGRPGYEKMWELSL